jgi:catechol 2,3-dioxygenase-like lactoylglutathione lyase family enzyme
VQARLKAHDDHVGEGWAAVKPAGIDDGITAYDGLAVATAVASATVEPMTIQRMDHVGVVVNDLAAAMEFFAELGLRLHGEGQVEGAWVDRVVGLEGIRAQIAMLETSDGHARLELTKFHAPSSPGGDRHAPPNTPGIRHLAFEVDDIDAVIVGLRARGTELVGEVERYGDSYRLCYVRGPEGIIVELAEKLG